MDRPLGAQISHMLKDRGVEVIFGIPGVHNQEMYRGIEEAGITHVLARHEQGAGFMADGYARATGRPGVAYVISGPGLTNVMTPMGQAYSDSVPMLVISSCLDETAATRGQLHQMRDQRAAAETVCDWSHEARSPEAAYALIDRALVEFETARPRSKHIQVPIAQLEARAPVAPAAPSVSGAGPSPKHAPFAGYVVSRLRESRRPLFIFGGGLVSDPTSDQPSGWIERLLRQSGAASFTTYAGSGLVAADGPLHFGSYLARPGSAEVIGSSDLVIAIGTELAEVDLWRSYLGPTGHVIRIDADPEVAQDRHRATEGIVCDAFAAVISLGDRSHWQGIHDTDWSPEEVAQARSRWRAEVTAERPAIVPVCDALSAALPAETMIYSDMTQFAYAAKEVWDMPRAGHWHHPTGFGTLGYAMPAAIGGAMGRRGLPTMAIAGDYGFQYTIQELGTAVELGLPLPILLWDNGKLGEIEDSMVRAQIAPNAVVQRNPDFLALARAYGAEAAEPGDLDGLVDEVMAAFGRSVPTVIRVTPDLAG